MIIFTKQKKRRAGIKDKKMSIMPKDDRKVATPRTTLQEADTMTVCINPMHLVFLLLSLTAFIPLQNVNAAWDVPSKASTMYCGVQNKVIPVGNEVSRTALENPGSYSYATIARDDSYWLKDANGNSISYQWSLWLRNDKYSDKMVRVVIWNKFGDQSSDGYNCPDPSLTNQDNKWRSEEEGWKHLEILYEIPPTGTITVNTNLASASFSISGPAPYSGSGTTWSQADAPTGTYTISYGAVSGYNTPPSEPKTLTGGGSITFTGTYTLKDSDSDGVSDSQDKCPSTPAGATVDSTGCSASQKDTDGDGIKDNVDRCPTQPENFNGYQDSDGCPDVKPDTDGDGISDDLDACPTKPGPANNSGCPVNKPPIAVLFATQTTIYEGVSVSFDATGSMDTDGSIVSYKWSFGDGTTGTGKAVSHTYATSGSYTVVLTVTDNDGATDSDKIVITVKPQIVQTTLPPQTTQSPSTVSPPAVDVSGKTATVSISSLPAEKTVTAQIPFQADQSVTEIKLSAKGSVSDAKITIQTLDTKPAEAKTKPSGEIYRYISIEKTNIPSPGIAEVSIEFKVEKSWIAENNIDPATVVLNRYYNNQWDKLSTTKLNEDSRSRYVFYSASSPGLSVFAISGTMAVVSPPMVQQTTKPLETSVAPVTTQPPIQQPMEGSETAQSTSVGAILLAVLGVVAVGALLLKTRKKPAETVSPTKFTPRPTTPSTFPTELQASYTDVEYLGKGGFARVFKAKKSDGKIVAVKVPLSLDETTGKSFLKEIKTWEELKHENIVELYDMNIMPIPYLEMEYVENKTLEELKKPVKVEKAARIVFDIAEGLKYAHGRGRVHRDLKPQNILLTNDLTPKITDWGLSKLLAESKTSSIVAFTPLYASPEQISPKQFGKPHEQSDIYQLGVIFYDLVTGRLPFEGDSVAELGNAIISEEPPTPSEINPEAKNVEHIIMHCLAKKKEERYQNVEELQKELAEYLKLEYEKSLKKSTSKGDITRSKLFCADLVLLSMATGDHAEVLKYLAVLKDYAKPEEKTEIENLAEELNYRMKESIELSEELMDRIKILTYRVQVR